MHGPWREHLVAGGMEDHRYNAGCCPRNQGKSAEAFVGHALTLEYDSKAVNAF
jgi:hypothetical protein